MKVLVPTGIPLTVTDVPVPVPTILPPEETITVQVPDAGSPLKATLPVAVSQVGWVIVPTIGADGVAGWALTVREVVAEVQPAALVVVTV